MAEIPKTKESINLFMNDKSIVEKKEYSAVTISVCMIVKDEEPVIQRCLKNAKEFADELIIVDTGSSDQTKVIAKQYTDKVFDYTWQDDFADARNYSYEKATCDYVMWLDADDDIEAPDIEKIKDLKEHMPRSADVVFFTYMDDTDTEDVFSGGALIRDRLIRRSLNPRWVYPIHEGIPIKAEWRHYLRPDIRIMHRKLVINEEGRNLRIFEKAFSKGFQMDSNNRCYYVRELSLAKRHKEAAKEFETLWDSNELDNIYYGLPFYIESMKALKRYDELRDKLYECQERFGQDELILCTLGDLYRQEGMHHEAINLYLQAMSVYIDLTDYKAHVPAYSNFLPLLGMCKSYYNLGEKEKAADCLLKAEKIHPSSLELKLLKLKLK